jgi:fatty acid desaturase
MAFVNIKNKKIEKHQKMMIYSYAACFAAVTLRIWLPLLIIVFGSFITAYTIVAWLCWVPNLIVAILITRRLETHKI